MTSSCACKEIPDWDSAKPNTATSETYNYPQCPQGSRAPSSSFVLAVVKYPTQIKVMQRYPCPEVDRFLKQVPIDKLPKQLSKREQW